MKTILRTIVFLLLIILVNQNSFGQCAPIYRSIPYTQDFSSWISKCGNLNIPDSNWTNVPFTGADSWRRDDQGYTAGWPYYTNDPSYFSNNGLPASAIGNYSACFSGAGAQDVNGTGTLNLYLNCSTDTDKKELSFYYIYEGSSNYMTIYLSTDSGVTFTMIGNTYGYTPNGWTQYTIPINSNSAGTVISFVATEVGDENSIGLSNVQILPACKDKPSVGSITVSQNCPGFGYLLSLSAINSGISYLWQQSSDNINWSNISGDTSTNITPAPATSEYYRAIVTCIASGLSDTSASVNVNGFSSFYRSMPYTQDFESWMNRCDSLDVPDSGWTNSPSTGNASWRRDDQGSTAEWTYTQYGAYNPSSAVGNHSARFHAITAHGTTGTLNLYINCSTDTNKKELSFYYNYPDYNGDMNVYLSTDGGGTFTPIGTTYGNTPNGWMQDTISFTSISPTTVISFVATGYGGNYDIGLDYVQVLIPCENKPVAGSIIDNPLCNLTDSLALVGTTTATGLSYQWQQSGNQINWSNIAGDSLATINVSPGVSTYYRAIVTCENSGLSDTTKAIYITGNASFYRQIPYTENFESWISRCSYLDVPDSGWTNIPATGDDSWRRDDQGIFAGWDQPLGEYSGAYSPPSAVGNHSARFHSSGYEVPYNSTGTLSLYVNCSTITGTKQLSFFYINPDASGGSMLDVNLSTDGGNTFSQIGQYVTSKTWTQYSIPFTSDSPRTIIQFVATQDEGRDLGLDYVQVLTPCTGKPFAGTITDTSIICPTPHDALSLVGTTASGQLTFQWQQSGNNVTYSTIARDSTFNITVAPATSTYYRAIVTCVNSGLSDTTTGYIVSADNIEASFYRNLPYTETFESWITRCAVSPDSVDVPDTGWINNPPSGNDSWRRDDQGESANWGCPTCGLWYDNLFDNSYGTEAYLSSHSAAFDAFDGYGSTGALNLYVNCSTVQGGKQLSFYYINPEVGDSMNVYMSTDGGLTFSPSLVTCQGNITTWTKYTIPITSNSATTVISFVGTADGGSYDMGLDYVQVLSPCQGTPVAGNITVNPPVNCYQLGSELSLSGTTAAGGLSYTWQQSDNNITWSIIQGDTAANILAEIASAYYRAIVTCLGSGISDTTASVYVEGFGALYRKIPYTQSFESWMNRCDSLDVPDTGWINIPTSGDPNTAWRRDDQGSTADWNGPQGGGIYAGAYSPAAAVGEHSARFHSYNTSNTGILNLYIDCSADTGIKQLSFFYINPDQGGSNLGVYISLDGGNTFSLLGQYSTNLSWTQYFIPFTSDSAQTVIQFLATGDDESYDMGLDEVQVITACNNKPVAGSILTSPDCSNGGGSLLSLSGSTIALGISYIWQQSTNNITWSTIAGDTLSSSSAAPFTLTYYRAIVTCTNSGLSDTTASAEIGSNPSFYRTIPYTQNFESWMNRCDSLDVPDTGWINTPSTGNNSWRRNDQGTSAGWGCINCWDYTPAAAVGTYSACFNAGWISDSDIPDTTGTLDLYVNCSTSTGNKQLSFYYIEGQGDLGSTYLKIYLSKDGGKSFSSFLDSLGSNTGWTQYSVPIASDSPHTIIRFAATTAYNEYTGAIMGLDYVQVLPACTGKPTAGDVIANPGAICSSGDTSILSLNGVEDGGLNYQWQTSADSVHWSNITGATVNTYSASITSSAYYRSIVTCQASGLSDTSNENYIVLLPTCYCPPQTIYSYGDNIGNVTIKYGATILLNNGIDSPAINAGLRNSNAGGTGPFYQNNTGLSVVNLIKGLTYTFSTSEITFTPGGLQPDTAYAFIDYNQDGMWMPNERIFYQPYNVPYNNTPVPTSGTFTVPLTADTGYTLMRVQMSYQYAVDTPCYNNLANNSGGETEDYLVHIAPVPPCSGIPTAGTIEPASDSLCPGASVSFYLLNTSIATGLVYQWQSSPDNSTWSNISGAVNNQYSATGITGSTYYRCQVTCSGSGQSAYSTSSYIVIVYTNTLVIAKNDTICGPGIAALNVSEGPSDNYYWFTSLTADSLPVHSGTVYSPYVSKTTMYYVSSGVSATDYCTTGLDSILGSSISYPGCSTYDSIGLNYPVDTGYAGLVFNAQTSLTLYGVYIFPQFSGTFPIYLLDSAGNILNTATATVTNPTFPKPYWIPLDFSISAGNGYQLVAKTSEVNCMANSDSRSYFPFTNCNNNITITGGTKDDIKNNTYYFFYKCVINNGCQSQRVPATVYVKAPPALSIIASPNNGYSCDSLPFNGTLTAVGSGYTSFAWSPATGLNFTEGSVVAVSGNIPVNTTYTLTASNVTCNNVSTKTILVEPPLIANVNTSTNYNCGGVPVQISGSSGFNNNISYCLPSYPGDCNDYLSDFSFGTISTGNSSCPGYIDYADTALVQAGSSYTISITPSENDKAYGFGVWIDYNQNGVFTDSSELAFVIPAQVFSGSQTITGTIAIPTNALHGNTRMRVISFLHNTPNAASSDCNLASLINGSSETNIGTIEDFNLDITNNSTLSYKWSPGIYLSNPNVLNPIASPSVTTVYTLTTTDSVSGCSVIDTVTVYVYPNPPIDIYVPQDTLCVGQSEVLDAGSGFESYRWSTGDTTEQITITSAGTYSVQVTGYNTCLGSDTVNVVSRVCTGINQVTDNYSIEVYPNPFDEQFTLELDGLPDGDFILNMTNILGQNVLSLNDKNTKGKYTRTIDLHELPAGMYNISIRLNGENYIKQIIKVN